jgi:hypothetical protein
VSIDADRSKALFARFRGRGRLVDRAFPRTLMIRIAPERPVAVIRGTSAWLRPEPAR